MHFRYYAVALAIGLASVSGAALAQTTPKTYVMKYSGVVNAGSDTQDLFGGGDLKGDSFSEVFDVQSSYGAKTPTGWAASGSGRQDPISSATLTILNKQTGLSYSVVLDSSMATLGGQSFATTSDQGYVALIDTARAGLMFDSQSDEVCSSKGKCDTYTIAGGLLNDVSGKAFPVDLNKDWDLKAGGATVDGGSIFSVRGPCGSGEFLRLAVTSAAPEPRTWLMMLTGVGLLGAVLRRRRTGPAYA